MAVVAVAGAALVPATRTEAAPTAPRSIRGADRALGNGLGRLVQQSGGAQSRRVAPGPRLDQEALTIRDADGRVLVDLTPQAGVDRADFRRRAAALGLAVQSVDERRGTLEGYVVLSAVDQLAAMPGVGTLAQAVRPQLHTGATTSQGVALQRVDKVQAAGVDGAGVTIGALSDSYDAATTSVDGQPLRVHAADDVASGDLPGVGNPQNSQPVAVLEDGRAADGPLYDEGRGMLQIAHDVAPAAKLCFATAYTGLVGFADNVRRLADKSGRCGADVLVDDISYLDEPMYSDSPLTDAIDDVAAQGVHYFTSAGNLGEQQAWYSRSHLVPLRTGLKGTNLDFSDVDPALYSGGLQDVHPGTGVDVAQTLRVGKSGGTIDLQWDDPFDLDGTRYGAPLFTGHGAVTAADPEPELTFTAAKKQLGQLVEFRVDAVPSGSTDLVLTVTAPDGTEVGTADAGSSPEVLATKLTQAGRYTVTVTGYGDDDRGDFTVDVRPVVSASKVSTDYNILLFDTDGSYLGDAGDLNAATGRPVELFPLGGLDETTDIQMVISRSGTGTVGATRLRALLFGDAYFSEYVNPLAPAVFGHAEAKGATAVAAYDPFRPYLPEYFTSPGGNLAVFFDSSGKRYATLQRRLVPQIASADGGNTTFFGHDTARDSDKLPNFFGTSAAAPHAAAIAALALDQAGGPRSLTPAAMRARLKASTYAHDLDPDRSVGMAGGLTVTASGAQGSESSLVAGSLYDRRFFTVRYTGRSSLRWVRLLGETASPTALGSGSRSAGIVFDPRKFDGRPTFAGDGYPFRVGSASGGLRSSTVTAKYSLPAGTRKGQYRHLQVSFAKGLAKGQTLQFGVDRDLVVSGLGSSREGNGADELGGATSLPSGVTNPEGMTFLARRADGSLITGRIVNRLGSGYSPLDGYGLVNAQLAVLPPTS